MPFTLAHPAAVLPLRRFCPRHLDFGALVAGSICPDAGYIPKLGMDGLSHSFRGSFLFDLPVGLLMLAVLYLLRRPLVNLVPVGRRAAFLPLCEGPVGPPILLMVSLLLGIWSHLVWDLFTHKHGWLFHNLMVLRRPLLTIWHRHVTLSDIFWYVSSFGGLACLSVAYERWRHAAEPAAPPFSPSAAACKVLILGLLILPIEVIHHIANGPIDLIFVGACSLALLAGLALFIEREVSIRHQPPD